MLEKVRIDEREEVVASVEAMVVMRKLESCSAVIEILSISLVLFHRVPDNERGGSGGCLPEETIFADRCDGWAVEGILLSEKHCKIREENVSRNLRMFNRSNNLSCGIWLFLGDANPPVVINTASPTMGRDQQI